MSLAIARSAAASSFISDAHQLPVREPEAAHRGLGRAGRRRTDAAPTHLDDRAGVEIAADRTLHEAADDAVLHRYEAGRPDQVALLDPHGGLLRVIVLEAEQG